MMVDVTRLLGLCRRNKRSIVTHQTSFAEVVRQLSHLMDVHVEDGVGGDDAAFLLQDRLLRARVDIDLDGELAAFASLTVDARNVAIRSLDVLLVWKMLEDILIHDGVFRGVTEHGLAFAAAALWLIFMCVRSILEGNDGCRVQLSGHHGRGVDDAVALDVVRVVVLVIIERGG